MKLISIYYEISDGIPNEWIPSKWGYHQQMYNIYIYILINIRFIIVVVNYIIYVLNKFSINYYIIFKILTHFIKLIDYQLK